VYCFKYKTGKCRFIKKTRINYPKIRKRYKSNDENNSIKIKMNLRMINPFIKTWITFEVIPEPNHKYSTQTYTNQQAYNPKPN